MFFQREKVERFRKIGKEEKTELGPLACGQNSTGLRVLMATDGLESMLGLLGSGQVLTGLRPDGIGAADSAPGLVVQALARHCPQVTMTEMNGCSTLNKEKSLY